jgi:hypothetical protein
LTVGLVLRGWKAFTRAFSRNRVRDRLQREQKRKMREAVLYLRNEVIEYIDSEKHGVPNAPLTVLIKGSDRPIVDRGDLRQAITTEVGASRGGHVLGAVGVLRRRKKRGRRLTNVAEAIHEGFKIRVTEKVRRAVFAELDKRLRGKKKRRVARAGRSGGGGSKTWRVRGRPFISAPLKSAEQRILQILGEGVRVTFKKV